MADVIKHPLGKDRNPPKNSIFSPLDRVSRGTSFLVRKRILSLPNRTVYDTENDIFGVVIGKARGIEYVGFPILVEGLCDLDILARKETDIDYSHLIERGEQEKIIGMGEGLVKVLNMIPIADEMGMSKHYIEDTPLYTFFKVEHITPDEVYAEVLEINLRNEVSHYLRDNFLLKRKLVHAMEQRNKGGIVLRTVEEIVDYFKDNDLEDELAKLTDFETMQYGMFGEEVRTSFHRLINRQ